MAGTGREPFNVTARTPAPGGVVGQQKSPWHSPVPYLFGGLAAMLGLIAFALLILACSYWKLSGYLENEGGERDLEAGEGAGNNKSSTEGEKQGVAFEEKILVIMAGQVKPTFLATPMSSSRSSSFGDTSSDKSCSCGDRSEKSSETNTGEGVEMGKQQKEGGSGSSVNGEVQSRSLETVVELSSDQTH